MSVEKFLGMPFMRETEKPCPVCKTALWFNTVTRFYTCGQDCNHWYSTFPTEADREKYLADQREQEAVRHHRHRKPNPNCQLCQ